MPTYFDNMIVSLLTQVLAGLIVELALEVTFLKKYQFFKITVNFIPPI